MERKDAGSIAVDTIGYMVNIFSIVEGFLEEFITETYAKEGEVADMFYKDIISHSSFSFDFKRQVFQKALKQRHPEIARDFPFTQLESLQSLRNIFAHKALVTERVDEQGKLSDFFFAKKGTPFLTVYGDFEKYSTQILGALEKLPGLSHDEMLTKYYEDGALKQSPRQH